MFTRVVVGIDPLTRGRDAIVLAQRLVDPEGELILANIHAAYPLTAKGSNGEFDRVETEESRALLRSVRAEHGFEARLRSLGSHSVGAGLHRIVEWTGADLLVVGSTPLSRAGRVFLADMTGQALNGAPCAVAIAPRGYADRSDGIAEIGIAFDGSPESLHAVEVARALAREAGARLSAFEAVETPLYAMRAGTWRTLEEVIGEDAESARQRIQALGPDIEAHAVYGDAVPQLGVFSDSVDLLVAGSRGYGPIGRLIHGSTTRRLARVARCPLLILTRSDAEPSRDVGEFDRHDDQVLA
jgi:nucleotide-binding universal stress UspA family protein